MDQSPLLNPALLTALISLLFLWSISKWFSKSSANKNFPPSPLKLPIIGNFHQLGSVPHRSLHSLAKKHGPVMLLHLGSAPVLIISSADAAREIMKTHDTSFASRPPSKVFRKLVYNCSDVSTSPYGEYWRQVKSVLVVQLLSNKMVQSFRPIREEETALFIEKIRESSAGAPLDFSNMIHELSYDVICRAAFGRTYSRTEKGKKFLMLLSEWMLLFGSTCVGDFIPWLSWVDRVSGLMGRLDRAAKKVDEILEGVIEERMESSEEKDGENFADNLIAVYKDSSADISISRDTVKALLLGAFIGGTDTISTALEWLMSELLRHPKIMENLKKEIRGIVEDKHEISSDHVEKMQYLKAVIKESLRLHPPVPMLVPRIAIEDVKIKGYDVLAGTWVMINAWAIGGDPVFWDEPEKFKPERFLDSSRDFKGLDFEFIPFGAGRRGCPGIPFAATAMEYILASLVHKFEWTLPNGKEGKDLDMSEHPGFSARRRFPLLVIASPAII